MKKFVIIANPRTGSEYIVNLLNKHPDIKCFSELFSEGEVGKEWNESNFKTKRQPFEFLDTKFLNLKCSVCGYKQISFWMHNGCFENVKDFIQRSIQQGYQFIFIERSNLIKEYVSYLIMYKYGYTHLLKDGKSHPLLHKVNINPQEAYINIRSWNAFNKHTKKVLLEEPDVNSLFLLYEKDFSNKTLMRKKIFDFLGVKDHVIDDPLIVTNPFRLEEQVNNYEEVIEYFANKEIKL